MESLLDYGRSLLVVSGSSKAATNSVLKKTEMEGAAACDGDDETASLSSGGGDCLDTNCFDAFLDTLQLFSLQSTVTNDDDAILVPWRAATIAGRCSIDSVDSALEPPSAQRQGQAVSIDVSQDEELGGVIETVATPLGTSPKNTVTWYEGPAIFTLPPVLGHSGSTLAEYPRQYHNDRGQRDRRQRQKLKGVETEWLPELQDRRHHNDRGQRDRRRDFFFRHGLEISNDEISSLSDLGDKI